MRLRAGDDRQAALDRCLPVRRLVKLPQERLESKGIDEQEHGQKIFAPVGAVRGSIQDLRAGKTDIDDSHVIAAEEPVDHRVRLDFQNKVPDVVGAVPRADAFPKVQKTQEFLLGRFWLGAVHFVWRKPECQPKERERQFRVWGLSATEQKRTEKWNRSIPSGGSTRGGFHGDSGTK